jgi:hypothetical protein
MVTPFSRSAAKEGSIEPRKSGGRVDRSRKMRDLGSKLKKIDWWDTEGSIGCVVQSFPRPPLSLRSVRTKQTGVRCAPVAIQGWP